MEFSGPVGKLIETQVAERFDRVRHQSRQLLDAQELPDQIEAVHHFRVAVRRLRTLSQSFQDYFRTNRIRKTRKMLRNVFRLAGEVRNRDITILLFRESGEEAADQIIESLSVDRDVHFLHLRQIVQEWIENDHQKLKKGLQFSRKEPDLTDSSYAASQLLTLHTEHFFHAGSHILEQEDLEAIHEFRIAAKQFRYLIEVFQPVYGDEIAKKLKSLKKLQDFMGRLNDIVTARSLISSLPLSSDVLKWLDQEELKARTALVRNWRKSMDTEKRKKEWLKLFSSSSGVTENGLSC